MLPKLLGTVLKKVLNEHFYDEKNSKKPKHKLTDFQEAHQK